MHHLELQRITLQRLEIVLPEAADQEDERDFELHDGSMVSAIDVGRQRFLLTVYLLHLQQHLDPTNEHGPEHAELEGGGDLPRTLRLVVQGVAGTGKSHVIRLLSNYTRMATGHANAVVVAAPTGNAACNVGGTTMQRAAGFTKDYRKTKLGARNSDDPPYFRERLVSYKVVSIIKVAFPPPLIQRVFLWLCHHRFFP